MRRIERGRQNRQKRIAQIGRKQPASRSRRSPAARNKGAQAVARLPQKGEGPGDLEGIGGRYPARHELERDCDGHSCIRRNQAAAACSCPRAPAGRRQMGVSVPYQRQRAIHGPGADMIVKAARAGPGRKRPV